MRVAISLSALAALAGAVILGATGAEAGGDFKVEYRFAGGADGATPQAGLVKVGGELFGATLAGGPDGFGTLFSYVPSTGVKTVVYAFKGGKDGASPSATLIKVGGKLYGTTSTGGRTNAGTVFSFDPAKGVERVVYAFKSSKSGDGDYPLAALIDVDGKLWGTTDGGGLGYGTVFAVDPATGAESYLHAFTDWGDSVQPQGRLIFVGGKLYGTSQIGGREKSPCDNGCGTIFSVDPKTGAEALTHIFQGSDGAEPVAGLVEVGAKLYGTTVSGNATANCPFGCGNVYSLDPVTGAVTVVYAFKGGADGQEPFGEVVGHGVRLYGTTYQGGTGGFGTVFSIDPVTGSETVEHSFRGGGRGFEPVAGLTGLDGRMYGTAIDYCYTQCVQRGTIFSVR
jgi:uncharacterized repeat protein (TIGR03803 family)